jgi:replicative DNA helicase
MDTVQQAQQTDRPKLDEMSRQTIACCGGVLAVASPDLVYRVADLGIPAVSADMDLDSILACCLAQEDVPTIVPLMDEDSARELAEAAGRAGVPVMADPGTPEALRESGMAGWESLGTIVQECFSRAREGRTEAQERAYERHLAALEMKPAYGVADALAKLPDPWQPIPTGLDGVDEALDGGLPSSGLVMLGAVSSAGKTTLALQMADHIAATGREVLYVACEQSARELAAKSVSRLMKEQTDHGRGYEICPSSDILREDRRRAWGRDKRQAFDEALAAYEAQTGPFLHFAEPKEQPTVSWIRQRAEAVAAHSRRAGKRPPVVFIDYLQLLASPDPHMSDKQAMDSNVMALRQLARDLHMCVVAISALNRASYSTGITMESFRESSSIEYSADLLLGLQPEGMGERMAAVAESKRMGEARQELARFKQQAVRECELVVLKNRNGKIPRPIPLKCYAACSDFESVSRPAASSARVR